MIFLGPARRPGPGPTAELTTVWGDVSGVDAGRAQLLSLGAIGPAHGAWHGAEIYPDPDDGDTAPVRCRWYTAIYVSR